VWNPGTEGECGAYLYGYDSLWLPASLLEQSQQKRLATAVFTARKRARGIAMAAAELRKIVPHWGSYFSEGNFFNASWRDEFWGKNYSKLRAIKTKYDPAGLFFVHHGVGSEDWSADGFERL